MLKGLQLPNGFFCCIFRIIIYHFFFRIKFPLLLICLKTSLQHSCRDSASFWVRIIWPSSRTWVTRTTRSGSTSRRPDRSSASTSRSTGSRTEDSRLCRKWLGNLSWVLVYCVHCTLQHSVHCTLHYSYMTLLFLRSTLHTV